jgi:hypothetical protein
MDGWIRRQKLTRVRSPRNAYEIVFVFVGDDDGGDGGVRRSRGRVFAVARVGFGRAGGRSSSARSSSR